MIEVCTSFFRKMKVGELTPQLLLFLPQLDNILWSKNPNYTQDVSETINDEHEANQLEGQENDSEVTLSKGNIRILAVELDLLSTRLCSFCWVPTLFLILLQTLGC